ncbi:MAG TPA: sigma-70 family RNA polymerase sigma factor [Gemmatimonadaceae bacterium]|jgi:RNA polymerase sigma-70 factor (ECF subfamily)|nr:sigma-70 family RNA polymerase sigma factor [Gemmatimonadaceae bacterium]
MVPSVTTPSPAQAADRDREFGELALPQLDAVARVARALTVNEADADDLVQETFLRAYRHWHTFDKTADCRRWLATICRNAFLEQRRRDARTTPVDDDELESLAAAQLHHSARASGLDQMYSRLDLGPAIGRAIDALEPSFRDVVVLVDVEDFSYEQVAEALAIPIGTVRSRLYRARRLLQQALLTYAIDAGFKTEVSP